MLRSGFEFSRRAVQSGFTLAELCTTLAVAAILVAIGVPAMASFLGRTAVNAQAHGLMSALRLAKQEAMTRGELVSVCAMDPGSAGAGEPDCLPSGEDWSAGWIVFVDRDERGEIGAADRIVSVVQAASASGPVVGTGRFLSYRASGVLLSQTGHFRVLPKGQPAVDEALPGSALICFNKTGRSRLSDEPECD
jgi:type IV fimbrial biogenesis protein FimT